MDDLKACPFCGDKDINGYWNDDNEFEVGCSSCNIKATGQTITEAEKAWNNRIGEE